jgi:hypothetical protein
MTGASSCALTNVTVEHVPRPVTDFGRTVCTVGGVVFNGEAI